MKQYKLSSWPDLPSAYDRTVFRRMLSDMSQRHVSLSHLASSSGLPRHEVKAFLDWLRLLGLLDEREVSLAEAFDESVKTPVNSWFRRFLTTIGWN